MLLGRKYTEECWCQMEYSDNRMVTNKLAQKCGTSCSEIVKVIVVDGTRSEDL